MHLEPTDNDYLNWNEMNDHANEGDQDTEEVECSNRTTASICNHYKYSDIDNHCLEEKSCSNYREKCSAHKFGP